MAWTSAIDTIIEDNLAVDRSYTLEVRNGYEAAIDGSWTELKIKNNGWGIVISDANPVIGNARYDIGVDDWELFEEFNHDNPLQLMADSRFSCTVQTSLGPETEYLFRGTIRTPQIIDSKLVVEAVCPMNKLQKALAPTELEADINGPNSNATLRHDPTGIYDDAGTYYTYEIDPTAPGQTWAENIFGTNRAFVPGVFEVEIQNGPSWDPVAASEFIVDEPLGLIRFANDQGALAVFRLVEVSVYIEGTLELADVIEYMLSLPDDCVSQGCGFTEAQLITNLTGTVTFVNAPPYLTVTGVGTLFTTELKEGDRFALHSVSPVLAIVDSITNDFLLTIKYPYDQIGGTPGASGAAFVSGLMESGINLSNIKWLKCDGTAAELYRKLQENYADSKGYKIWYDHENDKVRGQQVRALTAPDPDIIDTGPVLENGLRLTSTTEDFATAVTVTGIIGRAKNLITDPAVVLTALAEIAGWTVHAGSGPITALNDGDLSTEYAVYQSSPAAGYHEYVKIDLGDIYDLSHFILYRWWSKNVNNFAMGVTLLGSTDDVVYSPLSPETVEFEMFSNESRDFDLEGIATVRYIIIECRPFKWVSSGPERSIGFWELIIYGSQEICISACIQGEVAHGTRQLGLGTITFNAGGPPWTVTGVGTNFGAPGEPQVGDYIAQNGDLDHWSIIETINAPTGPNCVELVYQNNGTLPSGPGALVFSDGTGPYTEGEGGHFIGGSTADSAFVRDYYPHLIKKTTNVGHTTKLDNQGIVFTEAQALDRAYLILDEVIRIYRDVSTRHGFDPRIKIFDTVHAVDDYRATADEDLYFLVQNISMNDRNTELSGTEYGAGVLE